MNGSDDNGNGGAAADAAETRRLVGVTIDDHELAEMRKATGIDSNATAVRALARMKMADLKAADAKGGAA